MMRSRNYLLTAIATSAIFASGCGTREDLGMFPNNSATGGSGGAAGLVTCESSMCDLSHNQICCGAPGAYQCAGSCASKANGDRAETFACDGPEDCQNGLVCCFIEHTYVR